MTLVKSREYKVMLEHRWFERRKKAVSQFWKEAAAVADSMSVEVEGRFKLPEKRFITFFDTDDHLLRRSGLVLRRRVESDNGLQFTLKARNSDRYIAGGAELDAADGLNDDPKFEEDIAAQFRSRFSHSNTVTFRDKSESPVRNKPATLEDAMLLFPNLRELRCCDGKVAKKAKLSPVNGNTANERVYKGMKLRLKGSVSATVAIILWSKGWNGRPLVAEFSFRYKDNKEHFKAKTAHSARNFFEKVQTIDWCKPSAATKTQYIYNESV